MSALVLSARPFIQPISLLLGYSQPTSIRPTLSRKLTDLPFAHHKLEHLMVQSELPQDTRIMDSTTRGYSYDTPEPEFPHITHHLSDLSQHYLDATAFAPAVSMGTAALLGLHGNNPTLDIAEAYASISAATPTSKYLTTKPEIRDRTSFDFDCQGILCEVANRYFVVVQEPPGQATGNKTRQRFGWPPKNTIGRHLVMEWESITQETHWRVLHRRHGQHGRLVAITQRDHHGSPAGACAAHAVYSRAQAAAAQSHGPRRCHS
jgi:hypothetical protein